MEYKAWNIFLNLGKLDDTANFTVLNKPIKYIFSFSPLCKANLGNCFRRVARKLAKLRLYIYIKIYIYILNIYIY